MAASRIDAHKLSYLTEVPVVALPEAVIGFGVVKPLGLGLCATRDHL